MKRRPTAAIFPGISAASGQVRWRLCVCVCQMATGAPPSKKTLLYLTYSLLVVNPVCCFIIWGNTPVLPTAHSKMALKSEQWMAQEKNEWEDEVWGGDGDGDLSRTQEGAPSPGEENRRGRGASHLVEEHHRGFDDLSPLLELSIVVLLLGL